MFVYIFSGVINPLEKMTDRIGAQNEIKYISCR